MVKRLIILLAFTGVFWKVMAQDSLGSDRMHRSAEFYFDAFFLSNAISNEFVTAFYRGSYIDRELREAVSDKLRERNRMGAGMKWGLTYKIRKEQGGGPEFSFSFFDRQHFEAKFSEYFFNTIFFGNKAYAGETVWLGNFRLNLLRYQQFRFGWEWKGDLFHGTWGFAGSLLNGEQNLYINAPVFDMKTDGLGNSIDLNVLMNVHQTDTGRKKMFAQNGMGFSGDLYYKMPIITGKKYGELIFSLSDLGLISWNINSIHHVADTNIHYEGIEVTDIFGLDSSSFAFNPDGVLNDLSSSEKKRYYTNIPCTLDVHSRTYYGDNFIFEKGVSWYLNTYANLFYYTRFNFLLGSRRTVGISYLLGYGGYGKFSSGFEFKADLSKNCSLFLANNYLFSGIADRTASGLGLTARLSWKFN